MFGNNYLLQLAERERRVKEVEREGERDAGIAKGKEKKTQRGDERYLHVTVGAPACAETDERGNAIKRVTTLLHSLKWTSMVIIISI